MQLPESASVTYAVCNTGPLISAFQSDSFLLLSRIFAEIHISPACHSELIRHGWEAELELARPSWVVIELSDEEEKQAWEIAGEIARHPDTNDPIAANHLGEAQAIQLALRPQYCYDILLLDELAARAVARRKKLKLSGFPGVLLMAVQVGLLSAEALRERLQRCRQQGTHYGVAFIQQVYEMAKQNER